MIRTITAATVATLLLLLAPAAECAKLNRIEDTEAIRSYRVKTITRMGDSPPLQLVEFDGVYSKTPQGHHYEVTVTERSNEPIRFEIRSAGGKLFRRIGVTWGQVDKFNLSELSVPNPDRFLKLESRLESVGEEEVAGRQTIHLRGDKSSLPGAEKASDSIDFSRLDSAIFDLWIDQEERFIVKLKILGKVTQRDESMPVHLAYECSEFNQPVEISLPAADQIRKVEPPAQPTQADVNELLGFVFPLPENHHVAIYGATVTVLTKLSLQDARRYALLTVEAAGFTPSDEVERAPGEFFAEHQSGDRSTRTFVFQVSERGATIQVGSPK